MPKTFYTEKDIEDLYTNGVTSLVLSEDVVVTDLGREKAMKLGFDLVREWDQPPSAPIRPYITDKLSPAAAPSAKAIPAQIHTPQKIAAQNKERVFEAVKAKLGDSVDPALLQTIIRRVVKNIGSK